MTPVKKFVACASACGVALALLAVVPATAQVKQGKTRAAKTKQLMKGLVSAQCGALKEGLDKNPSTDDAWADVALHAALLNEVSYNLLDDGRCPDGVWAGAAETLRGCSDAVLKAADAKDAAAAKAAFGELTKACGACHTAHKN